MSDIHELRPIGQTRCYACEEYRAEIDRLRAELEAARREIDRITAGLTWYANGNHYDLEGWDDCSGESPNWLFPGPGNEESWMVDNGGIARSILNGFSMNPDKDADEITIPTAMKESGHD